MENKDITPQSPNSELESKIAGEIQSNGGEFQEPEGYEGSVGRNLFDLPSSKDNLVSVIVPREKISEIPSQSLVRIKSLEDHRIYLGIVVEGPFFEPDNLRGDSPMLVTSSVRGGTFMPKFHARVVVEITAEEINGKYAPPRFRPIPNSPVFVLDSKETGNYLDIGGEISLGAAIGHDDIFVNIPANKKSVLPRHLGILGTTGGGKSTTVSGLVSQFQKENLATVLIDTEGEYTHINEKTTDQNMVGLLEIKGGKPEGIEKTTIYTLHGKETTNEKHPNRREFCLKFDQFSPYYLAEILEYNDAQQERFLKAYELAHEVLDKMGIYPVGEAQKKEALELDEFERGLPCLTLQMLFDIVFACVNKADSSVKKLTDESGKPVFPVRTPQFRERLNDFIKLIEKKNLPSNKFSWWKVLGRLNNLRKMEIFDVEGDEVKPIDFSDLTDKGSVAIFDLSDTDSPQVNNLVIADILRGLLSQQNLNYKEAEKNGTPPQKTMVIIEEAHEFLSDSKIKKMPELFQQVARISRRGRKRWLGIVFVTQLPQHLPNEVLGLINNFIIHKINDSSVIARLKKSVGGIDEGLWRKLPSLAPGQALVSVTSWTRPLMVAVNPTPCKLRMID